MLYGYNGKMLFVNLTDGKIEEKELTRELAENFIGGYGLGSKILYDMMPAGTDPLGPEIENTCNLIVKELIKQDLTDHGDSFLLNHTEAIMARITNDQIRAMHVMTG